MCDVMILNCSQRIKSNNVARIQFHVYHTCHIRVHVNADTRPSQKADAY